MVESSFLPEGIICMSRLVSSVGVFVHKVTTGPAGNTRKGLVSLHAGGVSRWHAQRACTTAPGADERSVSYFTCPLSGRSSFNRRESRLDLGVAAGATHSDRGPGCNCSISADYGLRPILRQYRAFGQCQKIARLRLALGLHYLSVVVLLAGHVQRGSTPHPRCGASTGFTASQF